MIIFVGQTVKYVIHDAVQRCIVWWWCASLPPISVVILHQRQRAQADRQRDSKTREARYKEEEVTDFSFVAFYYISVSLFVGISCAKARHLAEVMCIYNIQSRGATAVSAADKKSINWYARNSVQTPIVLVFQLLCFSHCDHSIFSKVGVEVIIWIWLKTTLSLIWSTCYYSYHIILHQRDGSARTDQESLHHHVHLQVHSIS